MDKSEVQAQAPVKASVDAVRAAMAKYDLPLFAETAQQDTITPSSFVQPAADPEDQNVLEQLFKLPR